MSLGHQGQSIHFRHPQIRYQSGKALFGKECQSYSSRLRSHRIKAVIS